MKIINRIPLLAKICMLMTYFWITAIPLHAAGSPRIGSDSAGKRICVWEEYTPASICEIRSGIYTPGSGWSILSNPISPASNSQNPILKVDPVSGHAISAWLGSDPITGNNVVQVAMYNNGSNAWGTPVIISPGDENCSSDYNADIDASGLAVVSWSSFTASGMVIRAASVDLAGNTTGSTQLFP